MAFALQYEKINQGFFANNALVVAEELLGKLIISKICGEERIGRIIETEAYIGVKDKACHARHGKTKRNEVMWGEAGRAYVYLCMGLHHLLNIVTGPEGDPQAVLIRVVVPLTEHAPRYKSYGPGNLTKYLGVDKTQNGIDVSTSDLLFFSDDGYIVNPRNIECKPRVGIDYAEEYREKPWRFVLKD